MVSYLNKWQEQLKTLGVPVSKWVIPKGKGKTVISPPYIVIGKNLDNISYADNKPYKLTLKISAMLVNDPEDEETEYRLSNFLWDSGINFESDEAYIAEDQVHVREYRWKDTVMYNPNTSY